MRKVSGFTIIELVVVITILGILAAVAMPKFFDIQVEARNAAAQGVAGAVASASAINYGAYLAKGSQIIGDVVAVTTCTQGGLAPLLQSGWPDPNVTVTAGTAISSVPVGSAGVCLFQHTGGGGAIVTASIIHVS